MRSWFKIVLFLWRHRRWYLMWWHHRTARGRYHRSWRILNSGSSRDCLLSWLEKAKAQEVVVVNNNRYTNCDNKCQYLIILTFSRADFRNQLIWLGKRFLSHFVQFWFCTTQSRSLPHQTFWRLRPLRYNILCKSQSGIQPLTLLIELFRLLPVFNIAIFLRHSSGITIIK